MHKAKWTGPDSFIPDLRLRVERGKEFEIPDGIELGGEGVSFDIIGGADFDALSKKASDLKLPSKLKTRLDLAAAIAAAELEAEPAEKAEE